MRDPRTAAVRPSKLQVCSSTRVVQTQRTPVIRGLWGSRLSIVAGVIVGTFAAWFTPAGWTWLMYPVVLVLVVVAVWMWLWIGGDA